MLHWLRFLLREWLVIPFTLFSLAVSLVFVGVIDAWSNKTSGIVFAIAGFSTAAIVTIELLLIVFEEWQSWPWIGKLSILINARVNPNTGHTKKAIFQYPVHAFDMYFALILSYGLAMMSFWVLDETITKNKYYHWEDVASATNVWKIWVVFVSTAVFTGNALAVIPLHWLTFALSAMIYLIMTLYVIIVLNVIVGWFFTRDHDLENDTHEHGQPMVQQYNQSQTQPTPSRVPLSSNQHTNPIHTNFTQQPTSFQQQFQYIVPSSDGSTDATPMFNWYANNRFVGN